MVGRKRVVVSTSDFEMLFKSFNKHMHFFTAFLKHKNDFLLSIGKQNNLNSEKIIPLTLYICEQIKDILSHNLQKIIKVKWNYNFRIRVSACAINKFPRILSRIQKTTFVLWPFCIIT